MQVQVGIVGAGPAGLFLALLLQRAGISAVNIESRSRADVEQTIRAGVLEHWVVELMHELGISGRMAMVGHVHYGISLQWNGERHHIDIAGLTDGKRVMVYPQHEVLRDLIAGRLAQGGEIVFEVGETSIRNVDTDTPSIDFRRHGTGVLETIRCDYIVGAAWSDDRIWSELHARLDTQDGWRLTEREIFQKSIVPLRSFLCEPMQYGRLFIAGYAAHIVPPTSAKGLNLAVADVLVLSRALSARYQLNRQDALDRYSATCLSRIWKGERFTWYMARMLHRNNKENEFERRIHFADLDLIRSSQLSAGSLAENYVGLPFEASAMDI